MPLTRIIMYWLLALVIACLYFPSTTTALKKTSHKCGLWLVHFRIVLSAVVRPHTSTAKSICANTNTAVTA